MASRIGELILDYEKTGFGKAISLMTIYEAVQRCNKEKELKTLDLLNQFTQLEITRDVVLSAGSLSDLYIAERISESQISTCDKTIASTAILTGSRIMTSDGNDYPRPFFNEIQKVNIQYKNSSNKDVLLTVYFLEPDLRVINNRLTKRNKS